MSRYEFTACIVASFVVAGCVTGCDSSPDVREDERGTRVTTTADTTEATDATDATEATEATDATEKSSLPGQVEPSEILSDEPDWRVAAEEYAPDPDAVATIAKADDAEIVVYLGTWCPDSKREVSRWLGAVDELNGGPEVHYVSLNRTMDNVETPDTLTNVPTFYVRRDGKELGRVVETAVEPIEVDIADLLAGRRSGFISASVEPPNE